MRKDSAYLNATVWARLAPSPIHGVGVFAIRDIPKGTLITDYGYGNIPGHWHYSPATDNHAHLVEMVPEEFHRLLPEIKALVLDRMLYSSTDKTFKFVSPNHDAFLQSFMNHADDPNTIDCITLRDVKKGEEITEDFRMLFDEPHPLTAAHHSFLYGKS